ncbi:MAG TPA: GGDEF domain-containing protein [Jatrophihabitans sp.]|nr:GGDEF domain-containing protein [Jatrophihabitans sp.]
MAVNLSASQWTLALSGTLAVGATGLAFGDPTPAILTLNVPLALVSPLLVGMFLVAELFLMNVEFRRQGHSITLASVPLVLGALLLPSHLLIVTRLAGTVIAFIYQRIGPVKSCYNIAAYGFEAAVDSCLLWALLGPRDRLNLWSMATVMLLVLLVDQFMSLLVLMLIRLHNEPLGIREISEVLITSGLLSMVQTAFATIVLLLMADGVIGALLVLMLIVLGTAIYRSYASTRRRHQALTLMHEFVAGGVGAESLMSLAEQLLSRIRSLLRAATVQVMIAESEDRLFAEPDGNPGGALLLTISEDEQLRVGEARVDHSDWVLVRALAQQEPTLAPRSTKDRALKRWLLDRDVRDALVVPLPESTGATGTLTVTDRLGETATFTEEDLTLLQTLTGHFGVAVRSTRLVERLGYEATHDSLTGLVNRSHLVHLVDEVQCAESVTGVLLLDLDRFKEVNDVLGHEAGDRLLRVVADRLVSSVPPEAAVARLGADEFGVLMPRLSGGLEQLTELAGELHRVLAEPIRFAEATLSADCSIGIAVSDCDGKADLVRQADTAMYEAKGNGQRLAAYGAHMDQGRIERLALLADLRAALTTNPEQLIMHYQPKLDLHTGSIEGVEALVRWNHPTLGVISPDRFIPLAESTGLIEQLTPLVLDLALTQCRDATVGAKPLCVAVNLSARNVSDSELPNRIAAVLAKTGTPPDQLVLEITESSVMGDPEQTLPVLHRLRELGVCLSLDDFGTGYSSLSYLQRLPVSEVKIDRSFVTGLGGEDPVSTRALISTIIGLGDALGLRIVAEGIEDQVTLNQLRDMGCDVAQGYFIARPMAHQQLSQWLAQHAREGTPRLRLLSAQ